MKWWHTVAGIAVVILAFIIWSNTTGPQISDANTPNIVAKEPEIIVIDENGNEINAEVWKNGTAWCARAEGYLPDCSHEENDVVKIVLFKDPGAEEVEVNVTGCSFFAYGPTNAPIVGPENCGRIKLKKGRYVFVLFDENGAVIGKKEALITKDTVIAAEENGTGKPARISFYDAESGEWIEGWLSINKLALHGQEIVLTTENCITAFGWAEGYKRKDFELCPGEESNIFLPRQIGGGNIIISAPGADRIIITDNDGIVFAEIEGDEARLENVPPGAYIIYAENGASVTVKPVDVEEGQKVITVDVGPGTATLRTSKYVEVYAMGEKVAEGKGTLRVPARTVLHVVVFDDKPREEIMILLPDEVKVI